MPAHAAEAAPFQLDGWLVEPPLNRVSRDGHTETIEPRMMHVLVCLAAARGEVVSRRDLLDTVWGETVVGEEVLTRIVSRLRVVLGDDRQRTRFIETIRGGGYRLLPVPEAVAERSWRRWFPGLYVGAILILALGVVWTVGRMSTGSEPVEILTAVPVTALPGNEAYPALAPDGVTMVFTWTGGEDEAPGLFVKQTTGGEVRRLTRPDGMDTRPVFSPSGSDVAFVRRTHEGSSIRLVPALGGATRLLTETAGGVFGLSWSPAGDHLVFAAKDTTSGQSCLLSLDLQSLEVSALTSVNTATHMGDSWPAHAPDGRTIAFARCDHAGLREVWLVPATGGPGRQLTQGMKDCQGLAWLAGGDGLIVSSPVRGRTGLWQVDPADGEVSWLPLIAQGENTHPTLAADGSALVFRNLQRDFDLKRLVVDGAASGPQLQNFSPSTRNEYLATWSPDAAQVAFISDRAGSPALWLARSDGTHSRLVAAPPDAEITALFWAPDSRRLAMNLMAADLAWVEFVDTETGLTHPLGEALVHERFCGWMDESGSFGLLRDEGEFWRLHRLRDDDGEDVPLDLELSGHARVRTTPLGHVFEDPESRRLWLLPADGGPRRPLVTADEMSHWRAWQYVEAGLHVVRTDEVGRVLVEVVDLADGSRRLLAEVPERTYDLAVSADGAEILLTTLADVRSDLLMVPGPLPTAR
ncbi:MAG: hypothetical protein GY838_15175 [bacterium]|nr:hypothetical protein [bacterium]